jgi:hypothetical protein
MTRGPQAAVPLAPAANFCCFGTDRRTPVQLAVADRYQFGSLGQHEIRYR